MRRETKLCDKTGIWQTYFSLPDADVVHGYFTANCWADADHLVLMKLEDRNFSPGGSLYLTDVQTGESRFLTNQAIWPRYLVQDGFLYQVLEHEVCRTEIRTGKMERVWQGEACFQLDGPPSLTADGRYLSLYWETKEGETSINRLDLQTGQIEEFCRISFPAPFHQANHCMLNPRNPSQMFFSHEGACDYITNRLWMAEYDTHSARNLFRQRLDACGANGEPCGHESWAPNGKGIYFVKYTRAAVLPKGVWYVDLDTGEGRSIASRFPYWHVACSPDGRFLAADTQQPGEYSQVILIDLSDGTERVVAQVKTDWSHPCHPHPQFSPDSRRICYTALGEDGRTCVGIAEVW